MSSHQTCGLYRPGHLIHWIQGKKAREPGQPVIAVRVVAVRGDGQIDLEGRDLTVTLWHHSVDALPPVGIEALWRPRFHVLSPIVGGMLCVGGPADASPCVPPIWRRRSETVR